MDHADHDAAARAARDRRRFLDIYTRWQQSPNSLMLHDIQWLIDFAERMLVLDAKP